MNIAKGVYRHIAVVVAEFFDIPQLTSNNISEIIVTEELAQCKKILEKGKGLLIFSAHFGNWELAAAAFGLLFPKVHILYRPLDNPFLDDLVFQVRSSTGNTPLPKEGSMMRMFHSLQRNETVGVLVDQNVAPSEGVFVKFFNHQACTTDGLAQLALRTGAPVMPMFLVRTTEGKYRFHAGEEMLITNTGNWDADVLANTQNITGVIENMVKDYPDQWLWLHHRWKTKPWQNDL